METCDCNRNFESGAMGSRFTGLGVCYLLIKRRKVVIRHYFTVSIICTVCSLSLCMPVVSRIYICIISNLPHYGKRFLLELSGTLSSLSNIGHVWAVQEEGNKPAHVLARYARNV